MTQVKRKLKTTVAKFKELKVEFYRDSQTNRTYINHDKSEHRKDVTLTYEQAEALNTQTKNCGLKYVEIVEEEAPEEEAPEEVVPDKVAEAPKAKAPTKPKSTTKKTTK